MYKRRRKTTVNNENAKPTAEDKDGSRSQKIRKITKNTNYLEEITSSCGMILGRDGQNKLEVDQTVFIQKLSVALAKGNVKRNTEIFVKEFLEYCSDLSNLKYSLSGCGEADGCDLARCSQDSLVRLLLRVDSLYQPIGQLLIDKMAEITAEDGYNEMEKINWVRMILQALKYLDNTFAGSKLGEQLFDIIHSCSSDQIQLEIIYSLPAIISDDENPSCARELSKLVRNEKLLGVTLDALSQLTLECDVQLEVQEKLLNSLRRASPDFLPVMVKFLLTTCDQGQINEVIDGLRSELKLKNTDASTQIIIFKGIQDCMLALKFLGPAWLKNISNIKANDKLRSIDVIILLIIYSISTDETRRRAVVTLIRNKIRGSILKNKLFSETFKFHTQAIILYFQPLMKIASLLLRSSDLVVVEIAGYIYSGLFEHVEDTYCKLILNELLVCIGASGLGSTVSSCAFKILNEISLNHPKKTKRFSQLLLVLLNKLNELGLNEARQLMDMLCNIAYFSDENDSFSSDSETLQSELNMLVQKQFYSLQPSVASIGVIGIVMLIKHIGSVPEEFSNDYVDRSIKKVPLTKFAKKAQPLFDMLLFNSSRGPSNRHTNIGKDFADILRLSLDQLSHMILNCFNFDQTLAHHMRSVVIKKMHEMYLLHYTSDTSFSDDGLELPLKIHFCLTEDVSENVAVKIGPLSIIEAEQKKKRSSSEIVWPLNCLNSVLKLLQALEKHDLSEIDALLGCGLILPSLDIYETSNFMDLSPYQQHIALNCLFYSVNWFRGILGCFSFLIKKKVPEKVLKRLRTVVWLNSQLSNCLPLTMEYTPPTCYFHTHSIKPIAEKGGPKKTKDSNKKKKIKKDKTNNGTQPENVNDSDGSETEEDEDDVKQKTRRKADLSLYANYFRELDIDVWLLLTQPLSFSPTPMEDYKFTNEMGPPELLFILDDFVRKLQHKLPSTAKLSTLKINLANRKLGFEGIDGFEEEVVVKNTVRLLGNLWTYLEKTLDYTRDLQRKNDGVFDSPGMFLPGVEEVKQCQNRILSIFSILFSWRGFKDGSNSSLLHEGLQKITNRICLSNSDQNSTSKTYLIVGICKCLSENGMKVLDMNTAGMIITLMISLAEYIEMDKTVPPLISDLCYKFLSRPWFSSQNIKEHGSSFNKNLLMLLENYIICAEDPINAMDNLVKSFKKDIVKIYGDAAAKSKFDGFESLPVFSKNNMNYFVSGVLKGLDLSIRKSYVPGVSDKDCLNMWSKVLVYLEDIVHIVSEFSHKTILRSYVKGIVNILRLIKNNAFVTFDRVFEDSSIEVTLNLKYVQVVTRHLQKVFTTTKIENDASIQHYIPAAREIMEALVLIFKPMFLKIGLSGAWFVGNMKHKDIKGNVQDSNETAEDSSEVFDEETNNEEKGRKKKHEDKSENSSSSSDDDDDSDNNSGTNENDSDDEDNDDDVKEGGLSGVY